MEQLTLPRPNTVPNVAPRPESFTPARNPLAGLPGLTSRVAVYVPSTYDVDQLTTAQVVNYQREKVAETLSRYFGGYTEVIGSGGWFSEQKGKVIRETVYIVYAGCDPQALARCLASVIRLAGQVARDMRQEAVTVEIDGRLYFVPPSAADMLP